MATEETRRWPAAAVKRVEEKIAEAAALADQERFRLAYRAVRPAAKALLVELHAERRRLNKARRRRAN